jgi:ribosomal protein S12 methylthiotransferase
LQFLEKAQLDRVGCFKYSPVDGAKANQLPTPVPEEIKQRRLEQFMQLQSQISLARLQNKIGKTIRVLIDEIQGTTAICRSTADPPEIDGKVYVTNINHCKVGEWINTTITHSDNYDLYGQLRGKVKIYSRRN